MSADILLPKLGFAMNEGTLAEWLVSDGSEVSEGQPIYTLESEKSVSEVESPASGRIKIIVEIGATCKVGTLLGIIE